MVQPWLSFIFNYISRIPFMVISFFPICLCPSGFSVYEYDWHMGTCPSRSTLPTFFQPSLCPRRLTWMNNISQAPLPSGLSLSLADGSHGQEILEQEEIQNPGWWWCIYYERCKMLPFTSIGSGLGRVTAFFLRLFRSNGSESFHAISGSWVFHQPVIPLNHVGVTSNGPFFSLFTNLYLSRPWVFARPGLWWCPRKHFSVW